MDTRQTNSTVPAKRRRLHPFGGLYGMVVGGLVGAVPMAATGEPSLVAITASIGAVLGAVAGHLLASRLKPNRTMING